MNKTFIELHLEGKLLIEDINDFIDIWHASNSKKKLYEFLGMTKDEYSKWIINSNYLKTIIGNRLLHMSLKECENYFKRQMTKTQFERYKKELHDCEQKILYGNPNAQRPIGIIITTDQILESYKKSIAEQFKKALYESIYESIYESMPKALKLEFWKYLLAKKSSESSWFKVIKCRLQKHKHGVIWYNPNQIEPDMHCKNCGDNLG